MFPHARRPGQGFGWSPGAPQLGAAPRPEPLRPSWRIHKELGDRDATRIIQALSARCLYVFLHTTLMARQPPPKLTSLPNRLHYKCSVFFCFFFLDGILLYWRIGWNRKCSAAPALYYRMESEMFGCASTIGWNRKCSASPPLNSRMESVMFGCASTIGWNRKCWAAPPLNYRMESVMFGCASTIGWNR